MPNGPKIQSKDRKEWGLVPFPLAKRLEEVLTAPSILSMKNPGKFTYSSGINFISFIGQICIYN